MNPVGSPQWFEICVLWRQVVEHAFQRPDGGVHKPITRKFVAAALDRAMAAAGLTGPDGAPLRITPHDFRRIRDRRARRAAPAHSSENPRAHRPEHHHGLRQRRSTPKTSSTTTRRSSPAAAPSGPAKNTVTSPAEWDEFLAHFAEEGSAGDMRPRLRDAVRA